MAPRPPVFDRNILPFDKTHLAQATAKLICKFRVVVRDRGIQETNHGLPVGLLCTRRERACNRRTPEQSNNIAPAHVNPPSFKDDASSCLDHTRSGTLVHGLCPLWVRSRHMRRKKPCPLYPQ